MASYNQSVIETTHLIAGIAACAAVTSYMFAPMSCDASEHEDVLKIGATFSVLAAVSFQARSVLSNSSMTKTISCGLSAMSTIILSNSLYHVSDGCAQGMKTESQSKAIAAWAALVLAAICQASTCLLGATTPSTESIDDSSVHVPAFAMPVASRKFGATPLLPTSRANGQRVAVAAPMRMGYIPDGLSREEWNKIQAKEKEKKKGLGRAGPRGYKSRSFKSFQESLERGEAKHLFPVDPKKVKSGEIPIEDVPYMQRGGAWDGSDLRGEAKKRAFEKKTASPWLKSDKEYAAGGYKKDQSVSIFGGDALPWTNRQQARPKSAEDMEEKKKKGPFGLW